MKKLHVLISHLNFIIAGIFITFLILDIYNPTMEFVNNTTSLMLLWVLCLVSIANSLITIFSKNSRVTPFEAPSDDSLRR